MGLHQVKDFDKKLKKLLLDNKAIKEKARKLEIKGQDPWSLEIWTDWGKLENISIGPATLYDLWALKEWYYGLSFRSRNFVSIFPIDSRNEKYVAMHLKRNWQKKDIIFNAWKGEDIIGHFLIANIEKKPELILGVADGYQKNKLGYFFIAIIVYILKIYGFERFYLTAMHENKTAFDFYQKIGFECIGDTKVPVPGYDYFTDEYEFFIDLEKFQ